MNAAETPLERLKRLQKNEISVRTGGKGTARRKKKVMHKTQRGEELQLQNTLKKLSVNSIPQIEEVNIFKSDNTVINFKNPKVQASIGTNTFAITGNSEEKSLSEMMPSIIQQVGIENLTQFKELLKSVPDSVKSAAAKVGMDKDQEPEDEVPELVANFDDPSKNEKKEEA